MPQQLYSGYSGAVWTTVYRTLAIYEQQLALFVAGTISAQDITLASQAMLATLINAVTAISAQALFTAWRAEISSLQAIAALPLGLPGGVATTFNNRLAAIETGNAVLQALIPLPPYGDPSSIVAGTTSIPAVALLEFFEGFTYETPPAGLTANNFLNKTTNVANAFLTVANAILSFQSEVGLTQLYDVAYREYQAAQSVTNLLSSLTSGVGSALFSANITATNAWNQIATVPALTMVADNINSAPALQSSQQGAVLRNVMLQTANNICTLLLSLDQPLTAQISITTLRNNETLMDVAARALGNYENWTEIAILNGLSPPYVGPQSSPGVAGWGSRLLLPTPGTTVSSTGNIPNYANNFLGVDLFVGKLNNPMPAWTGDFQTIAGYSNLSISLGRRIQTPLGALFYHPNFGSRIPPQVGMVQSTQTAGHITAFGKSAILSDPRVSSVKNAQTVVPQVNVLEFSADVEPSGFQGTRIALNEVISPL